MATIAGLFSLLLLFSMSLNAQTADVIFTHADIYSGGHFSTRGDPFTAMDGPRASTIAIAGGKVLAIGGDEVLPHRGPKTQIVDLGGHFVMPGFNDAHAHLASGGQEMLQVNLVGVRSLEEMK